MRRDVRFGSRVEHEGVEAWSLRCWACDRALGVAFPKPVSEMGAFWMAKSGLIRHPELEIDDVPAYREPTRARRGVVKAVDGAMRRLPSTARRRAATGRTEAMMGPWLGYMPRLFDAQCPKCRAWNRVDVTEAPTVT